MTDRRPLSSLRTAVLAACFSVGMTAPVLAVDGQSFVPSAREQEYIKLAARVLATVDACSELGVIDPGIGFLDDIELGMLELGASQEEVEEWISTVVTTKSPAIQTILKAEDKDAVWLQCTKDIDDKRRQLAVILSGGEIEPAPEGVPGSSNDGE